jgi:general secretion pathway protein C
MKRMPLLATLLALVLLSGSLAYWGLQLFKAPPRQIAALPQAQMPDPAIDAAASLFGGQSAVVASNYQLKGVVAAVPERDSVAIVVADGKPQQALKVGQEIAPGVTVKEVKPQFITLSEGGVLKRVELAQDGKANTSLSQGTAPAGGNPGQPMPAPPQPQYSPPPPAPMSATPTTIVPPPNT